MAKWKENKLVGVVAGLITIIAVVVVIKMLTSRNQLTQQDKLEIMKVDKIVAQEAEQYKNVK